ncbi:MAG TPA: CDP-alcohol phosphatidyltransferase family protein [Rhizomicrobium sp.]|jgi:cardiolipin synthase|nr:CDP-alcohol phosphatidyltransferase family protein [Rhizomicrobium sp.]
MTRHLPNLLSALRLALAPFAAWAVLHNHDTAALAAFAVAGLSDLLDGYFARRFGFTSRFGAWLDPIADKLLMLFCFIALLRIGAVPFWLVVLVVVRDVLIAGGLALGYALSLPLRMAPLAIGKATTLVEIGYVGAALLLLAFDWEAPRLMLAGAATVSVLVTLSALAYAYIFLRALFFGQRTA